MNTKYFIVNNEKRFVAPYVQKWGRAPSIAVLDSAMHIFSTPNVDGIIGYRLESNCALVFGDPLCAWQDMPLLVDTFHRQFTNQGKTIIYLLASEQFKTWAQEKNYVRTALSMGSEIILDPKIDPQSIKGKHASTLRNQYSQMIRAQITVKEYVENDIMLEQTMKQIGSQWLENRSGPQTSLLSIDIFSDRSNKRLFYAEHNNNLIGVFVLNRLDAYQGWTINTFLIKPDAPKYSSEYILVSVLDILRAEGSRFFSLGTLPVDELKIIEGLSPIAKFFAPRVFKLSKKIFKLTTRQQYWKKFHPAIQPSYLLLSKKGIGMREVLGIMRAFNANM